MGSSSLINVSTNYVTLIFRRCCFSQAATSMSELGIYISCECVIFLFKVWGGWICACVCVHACVWCLFASGLLQNRLVPQRLAGFCIISRQLIKKRPCLSWNISRPFCVLCLPTWDRQQMADCTLWFRTQARITRHCMIETHPPVSRAVRCRYDGVLNDMRDSGEPFSAGKHLRQPRA